MRDHSSVERTDEGRPAGLPAARFAAATLRSRPVSFAERTVAFTTCFNFRDLGGWRTVDGRHVRWRTLYRADTLHRFDDEDRVRFGELGIRTVVDLRGRHELERDGRLGHVDGVRYHHVPLLDQAGVGAEQAVDARVPSLADAYVAMAERGRAAVARCVGLLAEPGALPAVFHCTAGKDRTGIVAAVVLSAIGVLEADVVADYALTAASRGARRAWLAVHDPAFAAHLDTLPPEALEVRPAAIAALVEHLRLAYGSAAAYLRAGGLADGALARLRQGLLEG